MALKFLNKKGWHTGSLRNVENVWKAEQKHEAEQKKLEELRKQIQDEKERNEFRLLQEKAGLVPKQERLEFLYDSGLSVGRSANNEGFKELQAFPPTDGADAPSSSASASGSKQLQPSVPGALFEDKPQSANDAWRKLHSDPLLMIRQREQEALARIKNNPVKMAMIRKTVEATEHKKSADKKKSHNNHKHDSSKHDQLPRRQYNSEDDADEGRKGKSGDRNPPDYRKRHREAHLGSENESSERYRQRKRDHRKDREYKEQSPTDRDDRYRGRSPSDKDERHRGRSPSDRDERYRGRSPSDRHKTYRERSPGDRGKKYRERSPSDHSRCRNTKEYSQDDKDRIYDKSRLESGYAKRENGSFPESSSNRSSVTEVKHESHNRRRNVAPKLSEEERAAKLREMQLAAELHEEQRWKRLKKAEENDAKEAIPSCVSVGMNFLDAAQKCVYGAGEGGSSSIAESVRRRTHYSQGRSAAGEGNAFRR